jgi:hypothetical protein
VPTTCTYRCAPAWSAGTTVSGEKDVTAPSYHNHPARRTLAVVPTTRRSTVSDHALTRHENTHAREDA